jgi:hypothetical protein
MLGAVPNIKFFGALPLYEKMARVHVGWLESAPPRHIFFTVALSAPVLAKEAEPMQEPH